MPSDRASALERATDDTLLPILATAGRAPRRNNDRYVVGPDGSVERRVQKRRVHPAFERRAAEKPDIDVSK